MKKEFDFLNINSIRSIVGDVLRYKKSGLALDLGCGAGRHAIFLAKHRFKVVAVDNRTEVLAALKELARLQKLSIVVRREDAVNFLIKNKFDVVISTMVLHFLNSGDQKKSILNMQECTKNNGINVVSSYTDKNEKETRPYLITSGMLKKAYEDKGWKILKYFEGLGEPSRSSTGDGMVRYWKEELIAEKL